MIFVDDGSTDGTWPVIEQLAADDPRILGIRFRRNFGKAAALDAGFHAADGDRIVTLDGDLQDDPAEIAAPPGQARRRLRRGQRLEAGAARPVAQSAAVARVQLAGQLAHGRPSARSQLRPESVPPRSDARDSAVRRAAPLRAGAGRGQGLSHVAKSSSSIGRASIGRSKYGVSRLIKGLLDLLTVKFIIGYGQRPQHLLGTVGLVAFLLGRPGHGLSRRRVGAVAA